MSTKKTPIITDLDTLKRLVSISYQPWWQKLLVSFFAINIIGVLSGITFIYKNFYLFQDTVREVAKIQEVQQAHTDKIHALEVKQATSDSRINNLEKDKRR